MAMLFMIFLASLRLILAVFPLEALSAVTSQKPLQEPQSNPPLPIIPLADSEVAAFSSYTFFASAAYCHPAQTLAWNCGTNCLANPYFIPVASGGNGGTTQYWYAGFDPTLNTVIVGHEGTDPERLLADLTDMEVMRVPIDPTFFPGLSPSIEVHDGFLDAFQRAAPSVLAAVQKTMAAHNVNSVTTVGHSLGAALSLLDAIYLSLHLPPNTKFRAFLYGLPRVGNQAFADYVDANVTLMHVNNKKDPIPIVPGMFLGFVHPSHEVHIDDTGAWEDCPGQDNESKECIVGAVPEIWDGSLHDHDGPYNGIKMGCKSSVLLFAGTQTNEFPSG